MAWLTLNDTGLARVLAWLEDNVLDFEIYNKGIWLQLVEQCANDTQPGDDIVFEIRARQSIDGRPTTVKLLRNCFTSEVLDEI